MLYFVELATDGRVIRELNNGVDLAQSKSTNGLALRFRATDQASLQRDFNFCQFVSLLLT